MIFFLRETDYDLNPVKYPRLYRDHMLAPGSSTTLPGRPSLPAMSPLAAGGHGGPPVVPPAPATSSLPYHPYGNSSGHLRKDI